MAALPAVMRRKDIVPMTPHPQIPSHVPATDDIPIVTWQYQRAVIPSGPCPDWQLLIGARVEIRRHGQLLGTGLVDDATPAGDIAWIAADGVNGRSLIEKAGGFDLSGVQP
jgi:hypothetical protein